MKKITRKYDEKEDLEEIALLEKIVSPLLNWYDQNARILPWRENRDSYRVWISEIMLQQTRVETVKPYYDRFMKEFPTIYHLAQASEEQYLKMWEGLGYYNRIRNIHKTACIILAQYQGSFPNTYEQIIQLPGIGDYTAGAISSICFDLPIPAVDGNVLRVITRITQNYDDIMNTKVKERIRGVLLSVYPLKRSGDFTQGLMEIGALICTPSGVPNCQICPLQSFCIAYSNQTFMELPVKMKKKKRRIEEKTVFLLLSDDKIAVLKRKDNGLLKGLYEFPNINHFIEEEELKDVLGKWNLNFSFSKIFPQKKHVFSHITWFMNVYFIKCLNINHQFLWVSKQDLQEKITLPTAFKKIYDEEFLNYLK